MSKGRKVVESGIGIALCLCFSACAESSKKTNAADWASNFPGLVAPKNTPESYQPAGGSFWTQNAPIPVANGLSQTTTAASDNGQIFVIGGGLGYGPDVTLNQTWQYNPGADTWTQMADVPTPIRAFGSAVQRNGSIYVFGGFDGQTPLSTLYILLSG